MDGHRHQFRDREYGVYETMRKRINKLEKLLIVFGIIIVWLFFVIFLMLFI